MSTPSKRELAKQLDDYKRLVLPRTLNLHLMTCTELNYDSNPEFISFNDGVPRIIREEKVTTFKLEDIANGIEAVVTIKKTVPHKIKN